MSDIRKLINLVEAKSKRPRAGTIPYYVDDNGQLFVCLFTSNNAAYGGTEPSVPKGGVNDGEDIMKGAERETHEETGIPLSQLTDTIPVKTTVVTGLTSSYELHVFASRVQAMTRLQPTQEGHGEWFAFEDALRQVRASHKLFLLALAQKLNYQ